MTAFWDRQRKEEKTEKPKKKLAGLIVKNKKVEKKAKKEVSFSQAESIGKIIAFPVISEDAMNKQALGKYVFKVSVDANKNEVKKAVSSRFGVSVEKVNIMNINPKKSFFRGKKGFRKKEKKAIVTLLKGQTIDFFPTK